MSEICFFGESYYRDHAQKFGIKTDDRRRHMYVIGKTGMGKTTLLENMVYSDVVNGHGLCYIDPHGDTAEKILDFIPSHRINDVIYFNPSDMNYPISFNLLESVDPAYTHLVASGMVGVFKKIWADSWGPRLEYILRNALLALLDHPDSTLLGVTRILVDKDFRKKVVSNIKDPVVKSFWVDEFTKFNDRTIAEVISPIQNKVGQFLSTALIRNIVGQVKSTLHFRDIMDNRKILILNLSKGRIGEDASALLGAMMITKIQLAAMSRVDIPEEQRADFYLYVDEFQNFATESFAGILSEARKYRLSLIVAHQYVAQLDEKVADAIFGNVGTIVSFRVGAGDAETLVKEFSPYFTEEDFVNLPKFFIYLKLMIDGVASNPFSSKTLPPLSKHEGHSEKIIRVTRERYARTREIVEDKINRWSGHGDDVDTTEESNSQRSSNRSDQKRNKREGKYNYTCDACATNFSLDVELDPTKPLFCKQCLEKKRNGELIVSKKDKKISADVKETSNKSNNSNSKNKSLEIKLSDLSPEKAVSFKVRDERRSNKNSRNNSDKQDSPKKQEKSPKENQGAQPDNRQKNEVKSKNEQKGNQREQKNPKNNAGDAHRSQRNNNQGQNKEQTKKTAEKKLEEVREQIQKSQPQESKQDKQQSKKDNSQPITLKNKQQQESKKQNNDKAQQVVNEKQSSKDNPKNNNQKKERQNTSSDDIQTIKPGQIIKL